MILTPLHDLDTDHVKHHIHLHGDTPFKHQGRPIRPCDIEAVRNHLQDVLVAGVMQESESPLPSPIVEIKIQNRLRSLC